MTRLRDLNKGLVVLGGILLLAATANTFGFQGGPAMTGIQQNAYCQTSGSCLSPRDCVTSFFYCDNTYQPGTCVGPGPEPDDCQYSKPFDCGAEVNCLTNQIVLQNCPPPNQGQQCVIICPGGGAQGCITINGGAGGPGNE